MKEFDVRFPCIGRECDARFLTADLPLLTNGFPIIECPKCHRVLEVQIGGGGSYGGDIECESVSLSLSISHFR